MKHSRERVAVATLADFLQIAYAKDVSLNATQQELLVSLTEWLAEKAPRVGLSKYNTLELVWERAVAPILAIWDLLTLSAVSSCVDLGAGTGVLGISLAIMQPDLQVDLVDRSRRAVTFMQLLTKRLSLSNIRVICSEVAELQAQRPDGYDLVCMRAVTSGEAVIRLATAVARPDGYIAAWHQANDETYLNPPSVAERVATAATVVSGLSVSLYQRTEGTLETGWS